MSLDPNKTYLVWNGTEFPNSTSASFKAPAGSTIDWGDGTVETFDTASTTVNTHTYTDSKTEHTIAISGLTSIAASAFLYCTSLTNITIGSSVTIINYQAFYRCSGLTGITIPNSVTYIDNQSFRHCTSLTSVTIPNSVTYIGPQVFGNCINLKQLILFPSTPPTLGAADIIPNNVQSIYVQQSSKAAYQAATNWNAFASKIVSDNIYLSFVRFNQKNKEYIDGKVDEKVNNKLTAPTTPTADSVVTMLADGTTGTKKLGEFALAHYYKHRLNFEIPYGLMHIDIITSLGTAYTQPSQFISLINQIPAYVEDSSFIGFAVAYGHIQDGITKFNLVGSGINPASPTESKAIQTIINATFLSDGVTEL